MPIIKNPGLGKEIQVGDVRIVMAIIGPIVQSSAGNHLPHIYSCYYCNNARVEQWTYREGPVKMAELVTQSDGQTIFWFGWR